MKLRLTLLAAALLCCLAGQVSAAKPTTVGITITPFLQKVSIADFETAKTFSITLTNHTTSTRTFQPDVADFGSLNESGGIAFLGQNQHDYTVAHGLKSWLTLDQTVFTLGPSQSVKLTGTIRNDDSLLPGGHYGAVLINEVEQGKPRPNSISTNPTISALIFADKLGGIHYDLHLAAVRPNGNWLFAPSQVGLRFYNPGNVEVTPRGTIDVLQAHGRLVSRGIINDDSGLVLPASYRTMYVPLHHQGSSGWLPKRLTLAVHYRYDGLDTSSMRSVSLFYWNLPHLILLLAIITGVVYLVMFRYRRPLWKKLRQLQKRR